MDYMEQSSELLKTSDPREYFKFVANGNAEAYDLLWNIWNMCHVMDDGIDGDTKINKELAVKTFASFTITLAYNKFFLNNKDSLMAIILSAFNHWVTGDNMAESGISKQMACADIYKEAESDICFFVALLTGGWDHMRACTNKILPK